MKVICLEGASMCVPIKDYLPRILQAHKRCTRWWSYRHESNRHDQIQTTHACHESTVCRLKSPLDDNTSSLVLFFFSYRLQPPFQYTVSLPCFQWPRFLELSKKAYRSTLYDTTIAEKQEENRAFNNASRELKVRLSSAIYIYLYTNEYDSAVENVYEIFFFFYIIYIYYTHVLPMAGTLLLGSRL